jgi:signal transduction histidine kinase
LLEALQRVTASRFRTTTVNTEVRVSGTPGQLPVEYEVVLLRAAQEALANSQRHAQPGHVTVTLSYMNDEIVLDVQDDGCGFDPGLTALERPGVAEGGAGLRTMRERLAEYGGTLVIESSAGEGTTVVATLPLRQPPAAAASDLSTALTMPPGA